MPRFDGTGPRGAGPMTGRGEGYCVLQVGESGEPVRGYVGLAGVPVGAPVGAPTGAESAEASAAESVHQAFSGAARGRFLVARRWRRSRLRQW